MIHGMEHRLRFPRLGVIKLGVADPHPDPGKRPIPREVDYFVLPAPLRLALGIQDPAAAKTLRVLFPSDDLDRVLDMAMTLYNSANLLVRSCDGREATVIPADGARETKEACQRPSPFDPCPAGCKAKGRLNVLVLNAPLGVWQVLIGGFQRLADLYSDLVIYRKAFGRLTDIPFTLTRQPTDVQVRKMDRTGQVTGRLSKTGYPVRITCAFTAEQALEARGGLRALPPLPPIPEDDDEAAPEAHDDPAAPLGGAPFTPVEPAAAPAPAESEPFALVPPALVPHPDELIGALDDSRSQTDVDRIWRSLTLPNWPHYRPSEQKLILAARTRAEVRLRP